MINDLDHDLINAIRNVTLKESEETDGHLAFRHHGEAWNKMLKVHQLLNEIHGHLDASKGCAQGDEHCGHIDEVKGHLDNARSHLDKAQVPLSLANVISHGKAFPEDGEST